MKKTMLMLLYLLSILHGDNMANAKKVYLNEEYKKALSLYQNLAKQGTIEANYYLGNIYYLGEGVEKDYKKAFVFYKKASDKGFMKATKNLALMYINGHAVKKDWV
jgi:TPR repeat protein